jgi:FtsP/CotA-like multicopper oxidase with cupredoxin domain
MLGMTLRALLLATAAMAGLGGDALAQTLIQCPGDNNNDAVIDTPVRPTIRCKHLAAGDGFITMGDGQLAYIFGFSDVTGIPAADVPSVARLDANFAAPTLVADQGDELFLTLTNIPFVNRPDLFDPHSVHYHGFPNAATIYDGEPEASVSIKPQSSFTYYYKFQEPGTYMYHCHVEATEHMQMGMLGNAYVRPAQNRLPNNTNLAGFIHQNGFQYVYNDGNGRTFYDVEFPIQITGFDIAFHGASLNVEPLPFATIRDTHAMFNGRGYPDTIDPNPRSTFVPLDGVTHVSQKTSSLVTVRRGQKLLLRLSSLDVERYYTVGAPGLEMRVVGRGARILRGGGLPTGVDLAYNVGSVTLGGGESADVIIDTANVAVGTYVLQTTNLNYLVNGDEPLGGLMTEIVVTN